MRTSFDQYADHYSKVIAEGARVSGETYEYMVGLRSKLFNTITANELKQIEAPAILDFGCGTGYTIERLQRFFPGAEFFGFDTSGESISLAESRNIPGACFTYGEKYPLPYEDNSFHAIFSNGTFHHIVQRERVSWMKELVRVLKKGGVLVIFENNPLNPLMMQAMRRTPFDRDAEPVQSGNLAMIMKSAGLVPYAPHYYFFFPRVLKWLRCVEPFLRLLPFGAQYFIKAQKLTFS
jgi:SAM-dependent methyltransferase